MQTNGIWIAEAHPILCKYTTINEQMFIKRNGISITMFAIGNVIKEKIVFKNVGNTEIF